MTLFGAHGAQDFEGAAQTCVNAHHPTGIVELAAVVRRREYSYKSTGCLELVPVLDHLMRSADDVQVMLFQEVTDDLVPARVTYSPRVVACEEIKVQAPFNFGCVVVSVRCYSLYVEEGIPRRSSPSLGRKSISSTCIR